MKSLVTYLNESAAPETQMLFENWNDSDMTLEDCYVDLFHQMYSVNEGLFSWLGNKLKSLGDKAAVTGENADEKVAKMTDSAKAAVEKAKAEAKADWDAVKGAYVDTVSKVDTAVQNAKASIEATAKEMGEKVSDVEKRVATAVVNALANGKEKVTAALADAKTGVALVSLINGAARCRKAGIDNATILAILASAGVTA